MRTGTTKHNLTKRSGPRSALAFAALRLLALILALFRIVARPEQPSPRETKRKSTLLTPRMREVLELFGLVGIVAAVFALWIQVQQFQKDSVVREFTLRNLAWAAIRDAQERRAQGNVGQIEAIELLRRMNENLLRADLSYLYLAGVDFSQTDPALETEHSLSRRS